MNVKLSEDVTLHLSKAEALVLFDGLASLPDESTVLPLGAVERIALQNLLCSLEKALVEPFLNDYVEIIQKARKHLLDKHGGSG